MEEFQLPPDEVFNLLRDKGITHLHHANTVSTSITFIENGALLSRHYVEANGLHQTSQQSDKEDKDYDVWDHIFLDGEDLHHRYGKANKYGPILFKLDLTLLQSPDISEVYVTRTNPWYWKKWTTPEQKFYKNCDDLKADYLTGKRLDSQVMFTLRNPEKKVNLHKYLKSVEIDRPKLLVNLRSGGQMTAGDYAIKAITGSLSDHGLGHVPILIRHNSGSMWCRCIVEYNVMGKTEFKMRFGKKE